MQPHDLQAEQFSSYPPEARRLVVSHLETFRELPLVFIPGLLREIVDYDFKFPAERSAIESELALLSALTPPQREVRFRAFEQLTISPKLEQFDWINQPAQFTEQLSAHLWSTHQLDAFRAAATEYGSRLQSGMPPQPLAVRRLGIAVIGQGVMSYDGQLFKNLRAHGTYFNQIKPGRGLELLLEGVASRSQAYPVSYGHWYVDGGLESGHGPGLTCVSYRSLEPLRASLLRNVSAEIQKPGMGPEELRTHLARITPSDLEMNPSGDAVLDRFQLKILTEGSGTQIFSTTFAQWTAREVLRRAQPLSLLVRFAPRQRQRPMNELLSNTKGESEVDPMGSLIDADMASYYHWINQQRLSGYGESAFLAWFEGHGEALVVAPTLPRGTTSSSALDLGQLLSLAIS
jgi:hypothetical protein